MINGFGGVHGANGTTSNDHGQLNKSVNNNTEKKIEHDTQTWMDSYESLRSIPQLLTALVVFGLIRSFMFRQETVAPDIRSATRCLWEDLSPELLSAAIYPKLVSFDLVIGNKR